MNNNKQRFLAVFSLIAISMSSTYAQDENICNSTINEQIHNQKWYNYLWQHLQFTKNMGCNMYGDNVFNSCVSHLGNKDRSYAMHGFKLSWEIKYNALEYNHWGLYAGVGYAFYEQDFKRDYVYFENNGSVGTFVHTSDPTYIANAESRQPKDFGLKHEDWDSSFSTSYITFPIGISFEVNNIEYGFTILPLVRVGNTSLYRDVSIGTNSDDREILYMSKGDSLDKYLNKFGCQFRFSCLYEGIIGGYVEFGTMSMTNNLKYDIYSFSIGVQVQLTPKNL